MLFNSPAFIFGFLPITLVGIFLLARLGSHGMVVAWMLTASLCFYAWWNPPYIVLLVSSVFFNYRVGEAIRKRNEGIVPGRAKWWLAVGVVGNLCVLFYYKYFNFFIDTVNVVCSTHLAVQGILLPLAISFFTFQQIMYLVDTYHRTTFPTEFRHYALFVVLFPHLIAGPIVRYEQVVPQFLNGRSLRFDSGALAEGIVIFLLGLFKKVCLADGFSPYVGTVFKAASNGEPLHFVAAWTGALGYTLQLYFDFSGYSDMAVGLACMMGIHFPQNFNSPYKAVNMIDFWRRWHITLSRFFRDYLYIPLGGNRLGPVRRHANIMITMLLGGLWHGANWTFVFWGGLHGLMLLINHLWHKFRRATGLMWEGGTWWGRGPARLLTFLCVVCAWVFFRADSFSAAGKVLQGMTGADGVILPAKLVAIAPVLGRFGSGVEMVPFVADGTVTGFAEMTALTTLGLIIVFFGKNLYEMTHRQRLLLLIPTFSFTMQQVLFAHDISEFLYFRF